MTKLDSTLFLFRNLLILIIFIMISIYIYTIDLWLQTVKNDYIINLKHQIDKITLH